MPDTPKERADLAWSTLTLYIRICELLYVCSAVYETRTYGAMRGAGGLFPHIYSILAFLGYSPAILSMMVAMSATSPSLFIKCRP